MYDSIDPVPPGMVDRIQFALTLDALHAEVAELQRLTEGSFAHRAETASVYSVTFASESMTTMISVTGTSFGRVRIDGWIAPALPVQVELRLLDHTSTVDGAGQRAVRVRGRPARSGPVRAALTGRGAAAGDHAVYGIVRVWRFGMHARSSLPPLNFTSPVGPPGTPVRPSPHAGNCSAPSPCFGRFRRRELTRGVRHARGPAMAEPGPERIGSERHRPGHAGPGHRAGRWPSGPITTSCVSWFIRSARPCSSGPGASPRR